MVDVEGLNTVGDGAPTGFSPDALDELGTAPQQEKKRGRGRPKKKSTRGPGRPTKEEALEKKLTAEEQERQEIAELLYQMLRPVNPDARGSLREFHYTDDQLQAICAAAAPVWIKYFPTGPNKYSDEMNLLFILGVTLAPKFSQYRTRRINEGNPIRVFSRAWEWVRVKLFKRKPKPVFIPASRLTENEQHSTNGHAES